jgi:transglutaminase-like putative cysteine protease
MHINYGYRIELSCTQPTPMVCLLDVHADRRGDIVRETPVVTEPFVQTASYTDTFGNHCRRLLIPPGDFAIQQDGVIADRGLYDPVVPGAVQHSIADLPFDCLMYLMGSRYCETDRLSQIAWDTFGTVAPGWAKVQAICDFVHNHIAFGYQHARATRTALEAYNERVGVCRDYAHLAITLCRCMNIPARYVNGYLGDIGVPIAPEPMDFSAWFEAYLGGRWYTFDARHNVQRMGRIVVACGRDAADVPLINTFGQHTLKSFTVWSDEMAANATNAWGSGRTAPAAGVSAPGP